MAIDFLEPRAYLPFLGDHPRAQQAAERLSNLLKPTGIVTEEDVVEITLQEMGISAEEAAKLWHRICTSPSHD